MKAVLLATLLLFPIFNSSLAHAEATLSFSPNQSSFQFDASGNLAFALMPDGVVTTEPNCRMKFLLASKPAPLNKGKIKNAASAPEGALVLFTVATPANLPNSTLTVSTAALSSKPKKGAVYGRAALQCGTKKKLFVLSPIVTFDYSLITSASGKSTPQVAKEWKGKTLTSF